MSIQQLPAPKSGIPTGNTAARPASPAVGDVFYNGQTLLLEIWDGSAWRPTSAPPSAPTITVTDVGTSRAFGSAAATVTFTGTTTGGANVGYIAKTSDNTYSATSTSTTITLVTGAATTYNILGVAYNQMGVSDTTANSSVALTTVPQAPTIGTATTSTTTTDVTVTWTLNNNGGKNLSSIRVVPYIGSTPQTATTAATTTSTSATITGLTSGTSYTFRVIAVNANGDSAESAGSNSITVPTLITVNYLVIGGGGGSGTRGGGGAGGYRTSTGTSGGGAAAENALIIPAGLNFTVTIGAGGTEFGNPGGQGTSSVLYNITSLGGGGGGGTNLGGTTGGSGGGAGMVVAAGAAGTTGQGFAGGANNIANPGGGGGGGGAGGAGNASSGNDTPGNGGNGVASNITGTSVTRAGGGAAYNSAGGGRVGNNGSGQAGAGGGGDASSSPTSRAGLVVIVYPQNFSATVSGGLTSSTNTSGNNKITSFNAGTGTVSLA